jgi:hypothetical protein
VQNAKLHEGHACRTTNFHSTPVLEIVNYKDTVILALLWVFETPKQDLVVCHTGYQGHATHWEKLHMACRLAGLLTLVLPTAEMSATVVTVAMVAAASTPRGITICKATLAARAAAHPLRRALALCAQ